jgi:hypothetical protein
VEKVQEHINNEVNEDIGKLYDHAKIANEEMFVIKNDIAWIKKIIESHDAKLWTILASIVIGILLQIGLSFK